MLAGQWDAARRAVSAAAEGEPRRALARALIPAAADAHAFSVAMALIEENNLQEEFPEVSFFSFLFIINKNNDDNDDK